MEESQSRCRLCLGAAHPLHQGIIFEKSIQYYECSHCGYVQTEAPYWLERAYSDAINACDTGIIVRNIANARIVLATLLLIGNLRGTVVDYAGGYGILVRLLRDYGVNAYWADRFCTNQLARGFEHNGEKADLVTAFEAFEHFENPFEEIDNMLRIAPNILFSTEIIPTPTPAQNDWWYYGSDHGQHIGFFRLKALKHIADRLGKYLLTDGKSYHLLLDRPQSDSEWRLLLRFNRLMPFIARARLKSRTWDDYIMLSSRT